MSVPEADGDERAAAYAACRVRVRSLLSGVTAEQEQVIVPACPDWTVRNISAHLAGVCRDLAEGNRPTGDVRHGSTGRSRTEPTCRWCSCSTSGMRSARPSKR